MALAITPRGNQVYQPDGAVLEAFFWDRSEVSIIQGPIGSGTSTACCHKIWAISNEQEADYDGVRRTKWLVIRESYPQLQKTTSRTWLDWFPEEIYGQFIRSTPMTHRIVRPHWSRDGTTVDCELIFLAIEDVETAEQQGASFEITGFWINEGQFHDKGVVDEILSRCARYPSTKNGPGATWHGGFIDMNAPVEGHWVPYMRKDIPMPEEWSDEQKREYTKPEGWKFFMQPPGLIEVKVDGKIEYQPNPAAENQAHLKKSYLQQIAAKPKEWIDRRVLNKTGLYTAGKPVYPTFSEQDHIAQRDMPPLEDFPIIVGLDFGRDPAAVFGQNANGAWRVLSELIGDNESAQLFAPRVKSHLQRYYPGHKVEFWGDPRGADGNQGTETTAYDVFRSMGMTVYPATTDNNPELRRSTVEAVLGRRNALQMNPRCLVTKTGMAGGYHYPKIKGVAGLFRPQPLKNRYSHAVDAFENMLLGGGESVGTVASTNSRPKPVTRSRDRVSLRR